MGKSQPPMSKYGHEDGIRVKNLIQNKNIGAYVSFTEKHIHLWRVMQKDKQSLCASNQFNVRLLEFTNSHNISCITYSNSLFIYFVVSTDFKIHVFNEYLFYVGYFHMQTRLINYLAIIEDKKQLITGGVDGLFHYQITLNHNYDAKQSLFLDPESEFLDIGLQFITKPQGSCTWIKGLKICNESQLIVSWSLISLTFNTFDGKKDYKFQNLFPTDEPISDVIFNNELRCFVTGTDKGSLIVWKYWKKKQVLHMFDSHKLKITCLKLINDFQNTFISGSIDNTIRIFSLEIYQELYRFNPALGVIKYCFFEDNNIGCLFDTNQIRVFNLQKIASSFLKSQNKILKVLKCFTQAQNQLQNHVDFLMCLQNNDSIGIYNLEKKIIKLDTRRKQQNKMQSKFICNILPPPKAQSIQFIQYIQKTSQIVILLTGGDLVIYNYNQNSDCPIELCSSTNYKELADSSNIKNTLNITSICISQNKPLEFDQIASQYYENKIQLQNG